MKRPVATKTHEPVFLPDERQSNDSPIKRTHAQELNNNIRQTQQTTQQTNEQSTGFQNNPYFNKFAGIQIPTTPQSGIPTIQERQHVNLVGQHVRTLPQQIYQQPQPQVYQHTVHQPQPQFTGLPHHSHHQQQHVLGQNIQQQQFGSQYVNQQFPQPSRLNNFDPRFQHHPNHPITAIQPLNISNGMPFIPPQVADMMNMVGMMGGEGAVILEMEMAPPIIEIGVD